MASDSAISRVRTSPGPGVPLPISGEKAPAGVGVGGKGAVLTVGRLLVLAVLLVLRSRLPPMASNPAPTTFISAPGRTVSAAANSMENFDLLGGAGVTAAGGASTTSAVGLEATPHVLVSTLVWMFAVCMQRTNERRLVRATLVVSFLSRYPSTAAKRASSSRVSGGPSAGPIAGSAGCLLFPFASAEGPEGGGSVLVLAGIGVGVGEGLLIDDAVLGMGVRGGSLSDAACVSWPLLLLFGLLLLLGACVDAGDAVGSAATAGR